MLTVIAICIIVLLILGAIFLWSIRAPTLDPSIPHRPAHWLLGHYTEMMINVDNIYDWFWEMTEEFDQKTFGVTVPGMRWIFLMDPKCVKYMFVDKFDDYGKGLMFHDIFEELLGDGIFNVDGSSWRKLRKVASHMFSSKQLRDRFVDSFTKHIKIFTEVLDNIPSGKTFDLQKLFFKYTFDAFCEIGFGFKVNSLLSDHPFAAAFDRANTISCYRFETPSAIWKAKRALNIGREKELKRCIAIMDSIVYDIVNQRSEAMKLDPTKGMFDILDLFLRDAKKKKILP